MAKLGSWARGALMVVALAGCGQTPEPVEPVAVVMAEGDSPIASVSLREGLGWPYWLERVRVAVDGELVVDARFNPDDEAPTWLAHVPMEPGPHTITAEIVAGYASTRDDGEDGCQVRLRDGFSFELTEPHGTIDLRVHTRGGVTTPFVDRVAVATSFTGGAQAGEGCRGEPEREMLGPAICDDRAPLLEANLPPASSWPLY